MFYFSSFIKLNRQPHISYWAKVLSKVMFCLYLFIQVSVYWMHRWYDPNSNWTLLLFCNITTLERQLQLTYRPYLSIGDCTKLMSLWKRCVPDGKSFIICTYLQDTKGKQVNTCPRIQRAILGEGFVNTENHVRYEILLSHFLMTSFLFNNHLILFLLILFWY